MYPDIAKLSDDNVRDVYGREQPIPPFNMFVAGTSCKNFSMLRAKRRIDIEDKGCSGETFLGATETLFKSQPEQAIFENVDGAPWGKMSGEYFSFSLSLWHSMCGAHSTVFPFDQNILLAVSSCRTAIPAKPSKWIQNTRTKS